MVPFIGGAKTFQSHLMIERSADPIIDIRVTRSYLRAVGQCDCHVTVVDIARSALHQRTNLLRPSDSPTLEITDSPRAVAHDPEIIELDRINHPTDHRLHRIPPELSDLHDQTLFASYHLLDERSIARSVTSSIRRHRRSRRAATDRAPNSHRLADTHRRQYGSGSRTRAQGTPRHHDV